MFFFCKQKTAYEMRISDWSSDVCSSDLHHPAIGVADVDPVDVGDLVAILRLALDVDLPAPAEAVEVVDVEAAERRLQRAIDIGHRDAQDLRSDAGRVGKEWGSPCRSRWSPCH